MPVEDQQIVLNALKVDAAARKPDGPRPLYELSEVFNGELYEYRAGLPTLCEEPRSLARGSQLHSHTSESVWEKLKSDFFWIDGMPWDHVALAGGLVGGYADGNVRRSGQDLDFFFYGLDEKGRMDKLKELVVFFKNLGARYKEERISVIRTPYCLRIGLPSMQTDWDEKTRKWQKKSPSTEVQIIFRCYQDVAELLYGFDLGSSAVALTYSVADRKPLVQLSEMGCLSYRYHINVVDETRRSLSYENRLVKYYERGFMIVVPNLNIRLITNENSKYGQTTTCPLPCLPFVYSRRDGNWIVVKKFLHETAVAKSARFGNVATSKKRGHDSDDSQSESVDAAQTTDADNVTEMDYCGDPFNDVEDDACGDREFQFIAENVRNIAVGRFHRMCTYYDKLDETVVTRPSSAISDNMIDRFYEKCANTVFSNGSLNLNKMRRYLMVQSLPQVLAHCATLPSVTAIVLHVRKVFMEQRQLARAQLERARQSGIMECIGWIGNPATQLTSSINPIFAHPEDWYGKYYVQPPVFRHEELPEAVPPQMIYLKPDGQVLQWSPEPEEDPKDNSAAPTTLVPSAEQGESTVAATDLTLKEDTAPEPCAKRVCVSSESTE